MKKERQRHYNFKGLLEWRRTDNDLVRWAGDRTLKQAWDECERADWLLWIAAMGIEENGDKLHCQIVSVLCAIVQRRGFPLPPIVAAASGWASDPTEARTKAVRDCGSCGGQNTLTSAIDNATSWCPGWEGWAGREMARVAWIVADAAGEARAEAHRTMCEIIRRGISFDGISESLSPCIVPRPAK